MTWRPGLPIPRPLGLPMNSDRTQAHRAEGVGLPKSLPRDPAHEPINWFETDYDDPFTDPDEPFIDPLPTARHRKVLPHAD